MSDHPITQAPAERLNFKALLLGNHNYFGTLKNSELPVVVPIEENTTFEAITCVGFNPELHRLEATVQLTQSTGYLGDLCASGTQEYVRFFVSFDSGASWSNAGMSAFTAHDITRTQPILHAVGVSFDAGNVLCFAARQTFKIRAILSWNNPPPAADPEFTPVWGNVVEVTARRHTLSLIKLPPGVDLMALLAEENLPPETLCAALTATEDTSPAGLAKAYANAGVPQHRFLFPQIAAALAQDPAGGAVIADALANQVLGLNLADLIKQIQAQQSDVEFERLDCVGFEAADQMLAAVFTLRRASGYSGGPCTAGSLEHVAFFIDWHDGSGFQFVGATAVRVYDQADIPPDGIRYDVRVPLSVAQHQRLCSDGPVMADVRAILSWSTPVPPDDPNFNPVWGNRQDAEIQIEPGEPVGRGVFPILSAVGNIEITHIDSNGLIQDGPPNNGNGVKFNDAPFGGRIDLAGKIVNGTSATRYRIMRRLVGGGGGFVPLTNEPAGIMVTIVTFDVNTGVQIQEVTLHADTLGYYTYQDYSSSHFVEHNVLSRWFSNPGEDGQTFELRVDVATDGNPANDIHGNSVFVKIDNQGPAAKLAIDNGADGQCADFERGATATGTFTALDADISSYGFSILPPAPADGVVVHPLASPGATTDLPQVHPLLPDPGIAAGFFKLDTSPMRPCGYALVLDVWDRTNVDSALTSHHAQVSVGFCVRQPGTP